MVLLPAGLLAALGAAPGPKPPDGATLARQMCSTCHAFTPPEILPKASWKGEVHRMARILVDKDIAQWGVPTAPIALSPEYEKILRFYESQAPAALPPPERWPPPDGRLKFQVRSLVPDDAAPGPAVANVRLVDLDGDERLELIASDMRYGLVLRGRPYETSTKLDVVAQVPHPSHVEGTDLDGDGLKDLVVADLGGFNPGDHQNGAVVWLRGESSGRFTNYSIGGFPRVADVEAADFDGDGRKDLVVAAFGWRRTGEIDILTSGGPNPSRPTFDRRKIDGRPGAIHAIPHDLNGDGRMDFVALVTQHFETVVAFINQGIGKDFNSETIYAAPHPNWGSSGIQLVDLDRDGDVDVLLTNGDMFDDRLLKPYHGIQWLENKGGYPFTPRVLARMPATHRAVAADLDGDGDLDVAACAFTAGSVGESISRLPSVVWLEQVKPGRFERHTLELGNMTHATLDVGDFDRDGDVDIVVGSFFDVGGSAERWVDVWENLSVSRERLHSGGSR